MVERGVEVARSRLRARHRAQQGFPPAAMPGEAGYGGSETGQVDRPFSILIVVINGRDYPLVAATQKNCCYAAYGVERAICPPPGPPVKSRAILTYPY